MNPGRNQVAFIDVSKAIAALCVSLFHFIYHQDHTGALIKNHSGALTAFTDLLWSTVFIFFAISGFAIVAHMHNAEYRIADLPKFLAKRLIRIYFPFLLCITSYLLLEMAFNQYNHLEQEIHWRQFFSNLTFSAGFMRESWYNPVFWTLAIEMQFYVFIAFAYPVFQYLANRKLYFLVLLFFLIIPFLIQDNRLLFRYIPMLGIGYALFLERNGFISKTACLASACLCCMVSGYFFGVLAGIVLAVYSMLFLFVKVDSFRSRFSEMTYSYYLFHGLSGGIFLYFTARYAQNNWMAVLLILLAVVVSVAVTRFVFLLIEKPSVSWSKKWIRYKDR